jgi:hypothetical protein
MFVGKVSGALVSMVTNELKQMIPSTISATADRLAKEKDKMPPWEVPPTYTFLPNPLSCYTQLSTLFIELSRSSSLQLTSV